LSAADYPTSETLYELSHFGVAAVAKPSLFAAVKELVIKSLNAPAVSLVYVLRPAGILAAVVVVVIISKIN